MMRPTGPHKQLIWPDQWPSGAGIRRLVAPLALGLIAIFGAAVGVDATRQGELMGLAALAIAPMLATGAVVAFMEMNISPRRGIRSVELVTVAARPAVFMPWSRVEVVARRALYAGFFLMFAALPVLNSYVPDDGSREYARISAISVIAPLFAVGMGALSGGGFRTTWADGTRAEPGGRLSPIVVRDVFLRMGVDPADPASQSPSVGRPHVGARSRQKESEP